MKRLAKIAAVLLAVFLAVPFTGCGSEKPQESITKSSSGDIAAGMSGSADDSSAAEPKASAENSSDVTAELSVSAESVSADVAAGLTVSEESTYTDKEHVALYIYTFGHLPSNYITKKEARAAGWVSEEGNLNIVCPGMSIGGDRFGNYEGLLPEEKDRSYYECDINYNPEGMTDEPVYRGGERIIYSNDGLVYYTNDHYKSFEHLY